MLSLCSGLSSRSKVQSLRTFWLLFRKVWICASQHWRWWCRVAVKIGSSSIRKSIRSFAQRWLYTALSTCFRRRIRPSRRSCRMRKLRNTILSIRPCMQAWTCRAARSVCCMWMLSKRQLLSRSWLSSVKGGWQATCRNWAAMSGVHLVACFEAQCLRVRNIWRRLLDWRTFQTFLLLFN